MPSAKKTLSLLVLLALASAASAQPAAPPPLKLAVLTIRPGDGVRAYRRGDSLRRVLWKKAARSGELVARDTSATVQRELWLDYQECGARDTEARLSRLAAWVIEAGLAGIDHGLRLPGVEIEPAQGDAHRRRCLEVLALWR